MFRFKDINILPKQLGVMGVVLALMVLNIAFGHLGISRMSKGLDVFSRWSNIDMVMNEAVTQNLLLTVGAVNNYSALPTAESYSRFEQALQKARDGLTEWKQTLAGHDDLLQEAEALSPLYARVESSMRALKTLEESRTGMVQDSDRLARELAEALNEVMEETIDPAKERAESRADIRQMSRWGAIDMVMNEAVIAPTLRLVTATHDCAGALSEKNFDQAKVRLSEAAEGLDEWSDLIRGEPPLENAARFAGDVYQTLGENIAHLEELAAARTASRTDLDQAVETVLAKLETIMEDAIDPAKEQAVSAAMAAERTTERTLMGLGTVSLVLGAGLAVFLALGIASTIRKIMHFAQAVATGDMERTLDVEQRDECGALADALRTMVRALKSKIAEAEDQSRIAHEETNKAQQAMAEADEARAQAEKARCEGMAHAADKLGAIVQRVASAVQAISSHAEVIRNGADAQTDRLQSTASAMEEMNATVLEVARNASDAAQSAEDAMNKARRGAGIVENVVQATRDVSRHTSDMKEATSQLGEQAESIGAIMGVITDIADQTNLLALNAAIEAARAGDAGRGFAVVADEVRKLAEKTMGATKEVGDAISGIQERTKENIRTMDGSSEAVDRSNTLTGEAGDVLRDIVQGSETSADRIQSIATAAEEQSATSEEINRSVEDINRIAAETSQGVAETTAALQDLSGQMAEMENLIRELKEECED